MANDMNFETIDVLTLLPQRPPFVMIDAMTHYDDTLTKTRLTVRPDNIFVEADGTLNPCALVENMAQTGAARLGYVNTYINKGSVRIGVIASVKNLQVLRPVHVGEQLTTTIEEQSQILGMTLVKGTVMAGNETVATGEMKIAEQ